MKNVYLANFSMTVNPGGHKFLPYSVANIWSYAYQDQQVAKNYQLSGLFFEKTNCSSIVNQLDNPKIFGFSVYIWNENYTDQLAQQVKKQYPECLIIYGGPQIPQDINNVWWQTHDYVDIVVFMEGEETFKQILLNLDKKAISSLPNVAVNSHAGWINTFTDKKLHRQRDLEKMPSPYLDGTMPKDIKSHHSMVIETNRGCPYSCTFCDWGSLIQSKLVNYDLERIHKEIEYCGKNKIGFLYSVDANFGMLKQRDQQIVDWIIETRKKYGYPRTFFANWAKNANENILQMAKQMHDAGLIQSLIMSLQTLTPLALKLIKRDNLNINQYDYFSKKCEEIGLPFDCEMIIGNPGETVDSWKETYLTITNYQALSTYLYPLALLPNAEIATQESREQFGFTTTKKPFPGVVHEDVAEQIELVTSTNWLTEEELKYIWEWTWCTRTGHEFNFTRDAADYLDRTGILNKKQFYDDWHRYVSTSTGILQKHFSKVKNYCNDHVFGLVSQSLGYRDNILNHQREEFYEEVYNFLSQYDIPKQLISDLVKYCNARLYNDVTTYPLTIEFEYNFLTDITEPTTMKFEPTLFATRRNISPMVWPFVATGIKVPVENFKIKTGMACTLTMPTMVI